MHHDCDVLVVGGGPAGCAAALAARRAGADVTLVERYNHLGGLSTGGLVIWIDRMSDWTGQQVITGFATEILDRLPDDAVAGPPPGDWGSQHPDVVAHWRHRQAAFRDTVTWSPTVDPEWLKLESARLLTEAGVRLLLHAWIVDTVRSGRTLTGAIFDSKQGRHAILARQVVDASGDLDVCAAAGARYESDIADRDSTIEHCINTSWTWAGVDFTRWITFKRADPDAHRDLIARGRTELGYLESPHVGWRDDVALFMGPRLAGYHALDVEHLTAAELDSRERMAAHLDWFRRHAPGFERAWIAQSGSQIGVRHTRRLVGRRRMCQDDWRAGVRHDDEIGVSPSPSPRFPSVSVPYACLIPADLDNALAAGRHVATDPPTHSFMREIPQCWLTGQAAGAAAALAADAGVTPAGVDITALQCELRRQGVYLHERPGRAAA